MTQKKTRRWLLSAIEEASKCTVAMPWQRGATRAETLARRAEAATAHPPLKRAAARTA